MTITYKIVYNVTSSLLENIQPQRKLTHYYCIIHHEYCETIEE